MKNGFLLLILSFTFTVSAYQKDNYYGEDFYRSLRGLDDNSMKIKLKKILTSYHKSIPGHPDQIQTSCESENCYRHVSHGYREARAKLFGHLHLEKSSREYSLVGVYCEKRYFSSDFNGQAIGPNRIPDHSVINAEHTWPQSRFTRSFPKTLQKSDLHALFPVTSRVNSTRGNMPFGRVVQSIDLICNGGARVGYLSSVSNDTYFEVPDSHKGNVARAMFYFSTRYGLSIDPVQEKYLREWHQLDPVDEFEEWRNDEIAKFQKTRNPYIDYQELVAQIDDF